MTGVRHYLFTIELVHCFPLTKLHRLEQSSTSYGAACWRWSSVPGPLFIPTYHHSIKAELFGEELECCFGRWLPRSSFSHGLSDNGLPRGRLETFIIGIEVCINPAISSYLWHFLFFIGSRASKRWSIWHGHFLAMGGITLVSAEIYNKEEPEEPGVMSSPEERASYPSRLKDYEDFCKRCELGPLTFERFKVLVQNPKFEFPVLTSAGIKDRSKSDALAKGIAIIQSTWFILQCVARAHQKLALTELELVTLALASLNAITFAFWWYKPLGVQEPVILYLRTEPPRPLEMKRVPFFFFPMSKL